MRPTAPQNALLLVALGLGFTSSCGGRESQQHDAQPSDGGHVAITDASDEVVDATALPLPVAEAAAADAADTMDASVDQTLAPIGEGGEASAADEDSPADAPAGEDAPSAPMPPSCAAGGPGLTDCGSGGTESCCTSLELQGGTFYRTYSTSDGGVATGLADPATVSSFQLDKYEVTVGRYREFVAAFGAGWRPEDGDGRHVHLNGGLGLANGAYQGSFETGWDSSWTSSLSVQMDTAYLCTNKAQDPVDCIDWHAAYAFCIWDGGFLPSEAEWAYAAAGGTQQREYPWGSTSPGTGNQYAIYDCCYPGSACPLSGGCSAASTFMAPVGSAPVGVGRWGQLDLAGNVEEWTLDGYSSYVNPCVDCAYLNGGWSHGDFTRGGSFADPASGVMAAARNTVLYQGAPGFRCARPPQAWSATASTGCTQGATQCSDRVDGTQTCDSDAQWGTPTPCTSSTCAAGKCVGVCSPGTQQCVTSAGAGEAGADASSAVQTCGADGQWATTYLCEQPYPDCTSYGSCDCNETLCNSGASAALCANVQNDPANCGYCGLTCGAGWSCKAGTCACASNEATCGAVTVDLNSDTANCGACGQACGGSCTCGRCLVVLASGQSDPTWIVANGGNTFWIDYGLSPGTAYQYTANGSVMQMPSDGGAPTVIAPGQSSPWALAVDSTSVYWTNEGTQSCPQDAAGCSYNADGAVLKAPIGGGTRTVLASGRTLPQGIAVDSAYVYWLETSAGGGNLMRVPIGGGTSTTLSTSPPSWTGSALAVQGSVVYWIDDHGGLDAVPTSGGSVTILVGNASGPSLITDSTSAYYTQYLSTGLFKAALDGGTPATLGSLTNAVPLGGVAIAVDATRVYWSAQFSGDGVAGVVASVPIAGGSAQALAWTTNPTSVAVDTTSLYWTDPSAGTVMKLTPK